MRAWTIVAILLCGGFAGCSGPTLTTDSTPSDEQPATSITDGEWVGLEVPAGPDGGYAAFILNETATASSRSTRDAKVNSLNLAFDVDFDDHEPGTLHAWGAFAFRLGPDEPCLVGASLAGTMVDSWPTPVLETNRYIGDHLHGLDLSGGQLYRYLPRTLGFHQDLQTDLCNSGPLLVVVGAVSPTKESIRMAFQTTAATAADLHRDAVVPPAVSPDRVMKPLASGPGFSMGIWERRALAGALVFEYLTPSIHRQGLLTEGLSLQPFVQSETIGFDNPEAKGWVLGVAQSFTAAGVFDVQASGQAMGVPADFEATHGPALGTSCPVPDCPELSALQVILQAYGTGGYEWTLELLGAHVPYYTHAALTFVHLDIDFDALAGSPPPNRFEVL